MSGDSLAPGARARTGRPRTRRGPARVVAALAAASMAAAAAGCYDDPSEPTTRNLLGLWGAVTYEYTSEADPAQTVDLVHERGASYSIELVTDGTYSWTLNMPGSTSTGSGTFTVGGSRLTLTPDGGGAAVVYDLSFNGIFMTLVDTESAWDFDEDGTPEPATLRLVLDRF